MDHRETAGNHAETSSDDLVVKRLDHLDDMIHALEQRVAAVQQSAERIEEFINEHKPALARGLALMDPGAKVREALGIRKRRAVQEG